MITNYNLKNDTEEKIVNSLKNLPRISAPEDFEIKLKHRLNTLPTQVKEKKSFVFSFNRRLIPAFGLLATVVLVFSLFYFQDTVEVKDNTAGSSNAKIEKTVVQPENSNVTEKKSETNFAVETPARITGTNASGSSRENKARIKDLISSVPGRSVDQSLRARPESTATFYEDNPAHPVQFNEYNSFIEGERVLEKSTTKDTLKDTLNKPKVKKK